MRRTIAQILEDVALAFDTDVATILGPSRKRAAARVRFAACWVLRRTRPDLSLCEIAAAVHRSDHQTILYALRQAERLLQTDPDFRVTLFAAARLEPAQPAEEPPPPPPRERVLPWSTYWYMRDRRDPFVRSA